LLPKKLPIRFCIVSQARVDDIDNIPGKPISEARRLSQEVDLLVFVCFSEQGKFLAKKFGNNFYIYTVPLSWSYSLRHTISNYISNLTTLASFLIKIHAKHKITFFRAENAVLGGLPTYIASLLTGTKYGIWLAGSEERVIGIRYGKNPISRTTLCMLNLLKRIVFSKAQFVLSVSKELLDENEANRGKRAIVTPNFVNLDIFTPREIVKSANDPINFLYAGRFETEKGIDELLDALDIIGERNDYVFSFAGSGTRFERIEKESIKNRCIKYIGKFAHKEMPRIYQASDVFVLPSLTEGMPAAVLEAMATGIPIIATEVGQIPRIIDNGVQGIIVRPGRADEMAKAIEWMIEHRSNLIAIGLAGRKRVESISGRYIEFHRSLYTKYILTKS
jgi:glycosyltransferase involved in cell wall biosynthesis